MSLELGSIVNGTVTGMTKFGAFVDIGDGNTGMVHISEVAATYVKEISDHISQGEVVTVKIIQIAPDGKIGLSIKQALPPEERQRQGREDFADRAKRRESFRKKEKPVLGVKNSFADKQEPSTDLSFEDMMVGFKQTSDDRMLDIKRNLESKKGGRSKKGGK